MGHGLDKEDASLQEENQLCGLGGRASSYETAPGSCETHPGV